MDHNKLWKILKEMGVPDHLNCLLRNLYTGQEVTVRTRQGSMDWFKIRKGECQGCILWPCLFSLYAEFSSVHSLSRVWLFETPWTIAHQASLSITNSWSSLKLTSIELMMPSSHLILCRPLFLLPPIPPSISLFQWVNSSHFFCLLVSSVSNFHPDTRGQWWTLF